MIFHTMIEEKVQENEPNELIDPIGDLRRSLNVELPKRDKFHKWYMQLKNLPEFFEIAKNRIDK
jgi:hypothetical protein